MRRLNQLFTVVAIPLVALMLSACQSAPVAVTPEAGRSAEAADEEKFVETIWAMEDALVAGDVDRLMEFYAEDAVSLPPGFPASVGKEAIEADFRAFYDEFKLEREFTLVDYQIVGDHATRRGAWTWTWTPKAGGDPVIETGKCVLGWEKVDGEWKIEFEIWNIDF